MSLPAKNSRFPPAPWDLAYQSYAENSAWYLGDTKALAAIYGRGGNVRPTHMVGGVAHAGGLMGGLSRMFWGRPVPTGQPSTRLHIPAPADLAMLSSDYGFAEPPLVSLPADVRVDTASGSKLTDTSTAQKRMDLIANSPRAHASWNTMGELKSVFGACALVTEWDRELRDHVWLRPVAADVILPEWRNGVTSAITLWTAHPSPDGGRDVYRHLQRHEVGRIVHALYRGTAESIGQQVPLESIPQTEHLAPIGGPGAPGSAKREGLTVVILTGINRLTASYNLNMPTRQWRTLPGLADTGRSDFAGILPLFDQLDETWTAWMRAIRLSRARIAVPEAYMGSGGRGQALGFDEDLEIFTKINRAIGEAETGSGLDFFQPDIPVEQYEATAYALYREILRAAGYSPSAWGEYGNQVKTATEVQDREKASERTRDKKALYDKQAISEQVSVALEMDGLIFPGEGGGRYDLPSVEFPAVSQSDPLKDSQVVQNLRMASAVTIDTAVRMAHPDWDDMRVAQEVTGIKEENPPAADPTMPF